MTTQFSIKTFDELTSVDIYHILKARSQVFVVEQNCPYLDADGKDINAYHLMGEDAKGNLHTYTRLLAEGISYPGYTSIGRVINSPTVRGKGYGKQLMKISIHKIREIYPNWPIKIGAQAYLKSFYESFGFVDINIPYLEDGIPHLKMVLV